MQRKTLIMTW